MQTHKVREKFSIADIDLLRSFSANSTFLPLIQLPHAILDLRNDKRRIGFTHARMNFSQSEKSSLLYGQGDNFFSEIL